MTKIYEMWTYTGKVVDPMNLKADDISLIDIGVSLSRQVRYNGHTTTNDHYSVARHSLILAQRVYDITSSKELQAIAFAHDFAEAYMGDIIRPIKNLCPALKELEAKITKVIFSRLKIKADKIPIIIDEQDDLLLKIEMAHFFPELWTGARIKSLRDYMDYFNPNIDYKAFVVKAVELFDLTDEDSKALVKSAEDIDFF